MEFNGTFIVAFISFIIFTFIMNIILYKPINDIVEKRKKYIDDNYDEAKNNAQKTKAILQDRKDKLSKAKFDAKEQVDKEVNSAKNKKDEITSNAKKQAKENIEAQRLQTLSESNQAKDALKGEIKGLAQLISDKFLNPDEKITEVDNAIVDKIMQE